MNMGLKLLWLYRLLFDLVCFFHLGRVVVNALCYKLGGRGFETQ
jgi:hypothetical protein